MLVSFVYVVACRLFALVHLLARTDRSKELEIIVLRHELSVLRRQARRPPLTACDRLVLAVLSRVMARRLLACVLRHAGDAAAVASADHRPALDIPRKRLGRPPLDEAVRELILRLARENTHWGYVRIAGELRKLGLPCRRRWFATCSPGPACRRRRGMPSSAGGRSCASMATRSSPETFSRSTRCGCGGLYVLFFISIGTRRVEYFACTTNPDTAWMERQARNLLMDLDDRGERPLFLIHDRDTKFSRAFDGIFPGRKHQHYPYADPGAERKRLRGALGRERTQGMP